jgi:hypothetical protein
MSCFLAMVAWYRCESMAQSSRKALDAAKEDRLGFFEAA